MNKIEEIEKLLEDWKAVDADDKMNGYSGFGQVNRGVIALNAALRILKRPSNTQMKWIRVEDRLPEEGRKVIYYFGCVGIHIGKFMKDKDNIGLPYGNIFYGKSGFLTDDVTHWMYLPEPPGK